MIFIFKVIVLIPLIFIFQLFFIQNVWAWGPAVHTVIACNILKELAQILPAFAGIMSSYPQEYIYGSLAADFFVGKGVKRKEGHSHNWESGFAFLNESKNDQETAYALGFLSHLAADIVAHNYFIPNLIQIASTWKRAGHIYWEIRADYLIGPPYIRIAKDILSMDHLECDDLLVSAVGKGRNSLKARRRLFTQSVKLTDYLKSSQQANFVNNGLRYQISRDYLAFMLNLSYRVVKDFLTHPFSSPCLSFDPIGSRNLSLAGRKAVLSRIFKVPRPSYQFNVDQGLLEL